MGVAWKSLHDRNDYSVDNTNSTTRYITAMEGKKKKHSRLPFSQPLEIHLSIYRMRQGTHIPDAHRAISGTG